MCGNTADGHAWVKVGSADEGTGALTCSRSLTEPRETPKAKIRASAKDRSSPLDVVATVVAKSVI